MFREGQILKNSSRFLVVNNYGIGNIFILFPLLQSIKKKHENFYFYLTYHPSLYEQPIYRSLKKIGFIDGIPPLWRRFRNDDHDKIINFCLNVGIETVLNLRIEAPENDIDYFSFEKKANNCSISCYSCHQCLKERNRNENISDILFKSIQKLDSHLPLPMYNWLTEVVTCKASFDKAIVLCTSASKRKKRWSEEKWISLVSELRVICLNQIVIMSGKRDEELTEAKNIYYNLRKKFSNIFLMQGLSIENYLEVIKAARFVITMDSFSSHAAAALEKKQIIIFLSTDGYIWRPGGSKIYSLALSEISLMCKNMRSNGTCNNYYNDEGGKTRCGEGVDVNSVLNLFKKNFFKEKYRNS